MLAKIEKIIAGGAGLARVEGKSIFIPGTIPGETVEYRITKEHRSWADAQLQNIIEASPDRVQPVCAHYGVCGGCNVQHLTYTAQIAAKNAIVQDVFARIGGFSPPEPVISPAQPWEYRNRMSLHRIQSEKNGITWGLKAKKSAEIVPITDCPIADPGIRELLQGKMPFLPPDKDRFTVYARNGLFLSEGGVQRGATTVLDRKIMLDAGVFFQSNGAMLEAMLADLREIAQNADRSLPMADLYCGVGTFSAFIGPLFPHVDLVETQETALALAKENLVSLPSAAFYAQNCEDWAKSGLVNGLSDRKNFRYSCPYGMIIVDPPRQGLNTSLAQRLAKNGPPLLVYVSCDPATLARDSVILRKGGYELMKLHWYDFYPQTAHIESVAVFCKRLSIETNPLLCYGRN